MTVGYRCRVRSGIALFLIAISTGCGEKGGKPPADAGSAGDTGGGQGGGGPSGPLIDPNAADTIRECAGSSAAGAGGDPGLELPSSFTWSASDPLIAPRADESHPILSIKDPTIVRYDGRYHLFATTASETGSWSMVYSSFADFAEAGSAQQHYLGDYPMLAGYHAAPQVFYFEPQQRWYLIFQSGQPQYTTSEDISDPSSWVRPVNFFAKEPAIVTENKGAGTWLDFWIVCDDAKCHLFFTDDNGQLYRSETAIGDFPEGFGEPVIAIDGTKETLFEGSATYRIAGTNQYLTLVEAFGPNGQRYYRSFVADTLDGEWTPLAATFDAPFASETNVTFESGMKWTRDISHGELLRDGYDQTLTASLSCLRFLFQGVDPTLRPAQYYQFPYRLALLTRTE
jgi:endo-1,4-beta-xylanase